MMKKSRVCLGMDFPGQLDILELLKDYAEQTSDSVTDYLSRGRVLMSLAKERAQDYSELDYRGFFGKLLAINFKGSAYDLFIRVRTETRKVLSQIQKDGDEYCRLIEQATGGRVRISIAPPLMQSQLRRICIAGMDSYNEVMLSLSAFETPDEPSFFHGYGLKNFQFDRKRKTYLYSPFDCEPFVLSDAAYLVAAGVVFEMLSRKGRLPYTFEETMVEVLKFRRGQRILCLKPLAWFWSSTDMLRDFYQLYRDQHEVAEQVRRYRESGSEYARSYQTKKDITKKTLSAMENSGLNGVFGFVEFDTDTDLEKAEDFTKQFLAFYDTYFKGIDASKDAIRFRKLGNHKASGLYYPSVRCLCVDYRILTSTVHEFGHLIDHGKGDLSLKDDFLPIRRLYGKYLTQAMREPKNPMSKALGGQSKYNEDYYRTPTEVFARSFELYCRFTLGVHNDLLPEDFSGESAVYPYEHQDYMDAINGYFDSLFGRKQEEKQDELKAC